MNNSINVNVNIYTYILICYLTISIGYSAYNRPTGIDQSITVSLGYSPSVVLYANGTQNYICTNSSSWVFVEPQAYLYDTYDMNSNTIVGYHYYLNYPVALGGQATWRYFSTPGEQSGTSSATSTVTGIVIASVSNSNSNSISSLLLQVTDATGGAATPGDDSLSNVYYIQRLNATGGSSPTGSCTTGDTYNSPYRATYWYYTLEDTIPESNTTIDVPSGNYAFMNVYSNGSMVYQCNPASTSLSKWTLLYPIATLWDTPGGMEIGSHYYNNVADSSGGKAVWQLNWPTQTPSSVVGKTLGSYTNSSTNNSLPWLLIQSTSASGLNGMLYPTTYIQRLSTNGGLAPSESSCVQNNQIYYR